MYMHVIVPCRLFLKENGSCLDFDDVGNVGSGILALLAPARIFVEVKIFLKENRLPLDDFERAPPPPSFFFVMI